MEHSDSRDLLAVYLRDHRAGAAAGLALARRSQRSNDGTPLGDLLAVLETEIGEDRLALEDIMRRLDVSPSPVKNALGRAAELAGRLKANGRIVRYSPLSRVLELEGLAAGIATKRNLWRSLLAVADVDSRLDRAEVTGLIDRASSQLDRVLEAQQRAAAHAFAGAVVGETVDITGE